jgi:hypothetical protein
MIQDKTLQKWRELASAATPGPWYDELAAEPPSPGIETETGSCVAFAQIREGEEFDHADARFIAAAREAVPQLLDEVERLREALAASGEKK